MIGILIFVFKSYYYPFLFISIVFQLNVVILTKTIIKNIYNNFIKNKKSFNYEIYFIDKYLFILLNRYYNVMMFIFHIYRFIRLL